eukprot:c1757_g1_i2.p1 GENE.c1757_g1_i2~~c1757_g1_i2.p1  ORF type:complete len:156 (+),score=16.46 c1757_g1_i2:75-542(+)
MLVWNFVAGFVDGDAQNPPDLTAALFADSQSIFLYVVFICLLILTTILTGCIYSKSERHPASDEDRARHKVRRMLRSLPSIHRGTIFEAPSSRDLGAKALWRTEDNSRTSIHRRSGRIRASSVQVHEVGTASEFGTTPAESDYLHTEVNEELEGL